MPISLTFAWWWVPIALVVAGFIVATIAKPRSDGGWLDLTPLVWIAVFGAFVLFALGIVAAKLLL